MIHAAPARNKPLGRPVQLALTAHFKRRWAERIEGTCPSATRVLAMVRKAVRIQPQRNLWKLDRWGQAQPAKVNGIYWHPGEGIVLVVDEERSRAVTVFGYRDWAQNRREGDAE